MNPRVIFIFVAGLAAILGCAAPAQIGPMSDGPTSAEDTKDIPTVTAVRSAASDASDSVEESNPARPSSGIATKTSPTTPAPVANESIEAPIATNPPESDHCLGQVLGEERFNALTEGAQPSQEEIGLMKPCERSGPWGGGSSRSKRGDQSVAEPTPSLQPPVPTPAFEANQYQGFWEPGLKDSIAGELEYLKGIGVNTMSFVPSSRPLPDGTFSTKSDSKQFVIAQIVEAHKAGVQVYLIPNFVHPSTPIDRSLAETYLENFTPIVLEWADIAEQYGVALFSPGNELDKPFPKDVAAIWLHDIIPKINERYHGLTIAKMKDVFDMDFSGYDYVGFTIIGRNNSGWVREQVELAQKYAERDGARGVIISEFGWDVRFDEEEGVGEETQAKTIEQVFQESWGEVDGYFVISWLLPGYSVKGNPAEQVIEQWFTAPSGEPPIKQ